MVVIDLFIHSFRLTYKYHFLAMMLSGTFWTTFAMVSSFFQMTELKKNCLKRLSFIKFKVLLNNWKRKRLRLLVFFCSSLIVTNETHQSAVQSWLPPNATCSLLFRASTDGHTHADFHRCCDNKGPTLVADQKWRIHLWWFYLEILGNTLEVCNRFITSNPQTLCRNGA